MFFSKNDCMRNRQLFIPKTQNGVYLRAYNLNIRLLDIIIRSQFIGVRRIAGSLLFVKSIHNRHCDHPL